MSFVVENSTAVGGEFRWEKLDKNGNKIAEEGWVKNLITNAGLMAIGEQPLGTWQSYNNSVSYTGSPSHSDWGLVVGDGTGTSINGMTKLFAPVTKKMRTEPNLNNSIEVPTATKHPNYIKVSKTYRFDIQVSHGAYNLTELGIALINTGSAANFEKAYRVDNNPETTANAAHVLQTHAFFLNSEGQKITVSLQPDEYLIVYYKVSFYVDIRPTVSTIPISYTDELGNVRNETLDVLYQNIGAGGSLGSKNKWMFVPKVCTQNSTRYYGSLVYFGMGIENSNIIPEERIANFNNTPAIDTWKIPLDELVIDDSSIMSVTAVLNKIKTEKFDTVDDADKSTYQYLLTQFSSSNNGSITPRVAGVNVSISGETLKYQTNYLSKFGISPSTVQLFIVQSDNTEPEVQQYLPSETATESAITTQITCLIHPFGGNVPNVQNHGQGIRGFVLNHANYSSHNTSSSESVDPYINQLVIFRNKTNGRGIEKDNNKAMFITFKSVITRYTGTP